MSEDVALDPAQEPVETARPAPARRTDWWAEVRGIVWLVLAVLGFHTFIAKPFYIPSESMLPGLEIGDQLVVSKFPYGWSFISPTFHLLPFMHGRVFGHLPERGDVVIVTPPGTETDYIKRVIGLPGETLQVKGGVVFINGVALQRGPIHDALIPVDTNTKCSDDVYPGALETGADGKAYCRLPLVTETLPNGRHYDTVELGYSRGDDYGPVKIPANHVFLMGDNRDRSSDSRFPLAAPDLGLGGPVPWEYLGGRAEFITFSKSGDGTWNPLTWGQSFRSGRAGTSLHPARTPQ
ncbi:S26 family signal peptidase [Sphingomonas panacis]|uniref:Signal peptidase I n=1 Tax=Sphingomonas panacis TaxID=1560345 RepID=A0A1B3Z6Q4_9SPHN|nr:signal peptidase I [Sphingomonas panacis]AOH83096.1 S26 family signal peptidase [Sphingomonas panacis]